MAWRSLGWKQDFLFLSLFISPSCGNGQINVHFADGHIESMPAELAMERVEKQTK